MDNQPKRRGRPPKHFITVDPVDRTGTGSWQDFVKYVRENGSTIIGAEFPNPPDSIIDTIWAGIRVQHNMVPRVMLKNYEWKYV